MKYILILAIILVALAKRHHQPDAILSCLQGVCKQEFDICDNSTGCLKQLKNAQMYKKEIHQIILLDINVQRKNKLLQMPLNVFLENALVYMESEIKYKIKNTIIIISYFNNLFYILYFLNISNLLSTNFQIYIFSLTNFIQK